MGEKHTIPKTTQQTKAVDWGAAIIVKGVRPYWLRDSEWRSVRTLVHGDAWQLADVEAPGDTVEDMSEWGWKDISAIRIPADHPQYAEVGRNSEAPTNEVRERMEALVRRMHAREPDMPGGTILNIVAFLKEADAIVALLDPVDLDLIEARKLFEIAYPGAIIAWDTPEVRDGWVRVAKHLRSLDGGGAG